MKNLVLSICTLLLIFSCNKKKTQDGKALLQEGVYAKSAGRPNTLTIVMANHLWEGNLGNVVRKTLADNIPGLPQEEPLFTLKQMPKTAFSGFVKKSRGFVKFNTGIEKQFSISKNKFARPQIGFNISGMTPEEAVEVFLSHKKEIINTLKQLELKNKQSFIKKVLPMDSMQQKLGYRLRVPNNYRISKKEDNFYWLRKDIPQGTLNLTLYNVDKTFFIDSLSIVENIIRVRDSIAGSKIPVNEGGKFITEAAFSPFFKNIIIENKKAFETRGTWEVKNMYMAGPFINYMIDDRENERYHILEGFVFAPTITKRDHIFELESIIKTIQF